MFPDSNIEADMEDILSGGFQLGDWLVKPLANKLYGHLGERRVEPKVMDVLVQLAMAQGHVVVREELFKKVWKGVVVNEEALTRVISELRQALGDSGREKRYIRTIPKRGYSLIPEVKTPGLSNIDSHFNPAVNRGASLAVLPFQNISANPDNEHFSDGLTEELISALTQINGLHIAASRSVFSFKDRAVSIKEIGDRLNVDHVLEGSVRRVEDRLRITTQLIQVDTGFQLWAQKYDKKLDDIFRIQEEIAQSVVDALEIKLNLRVSKKTANLEAYEQYLKGKLKYQNEQPGMEYTGIQELEKAITLAPQFSDAHGLCAYIKTLNSITEPYHLNQASIKKSYEAALSTDPFQIEALMAKALAIRWESWDWQAVKAIFEKAMSASPNCSIVMTQFATRFYRDTCQFDMAEKLLNKAVQLDPINSGPRASLSFVLRYRQKYEAALEEAERALIINPQYGYANLAKVLSLISMNEFSRAYEYVKDIRRFLPDDNVLVMNCMGRLYASDGQLEQSRLFLNKVVKLSKQPQGMRYTPLAGWIALIMGHHEQAVDWLEVALSQRISQVLNTRAFAHILPGQPLKDDTIQKFLRRINLDDDSISTIAACPQESAQPKLHKD